VGPHEDYISLSVERREDMSPGPHPESRLVREEDEIGEGEEGISLMHTLYLSH
jgi:GC-rich sequence DNA-binding factor